MKEQGKVIADYPDLDKIPFSTLVKLTADNILPKEIVNQVLRKS